MVYIMPVKCMERDVEEMRLGTYNCLGYENGLYPADIRLNLIRSK